MDKESLRVVEIIKDKIRLSPQEYDLYSDMYSLLKGFLERDKRAREEMIHLSSLCEKIIPKIEKDKDVEKFFYLHKEILKSIGRYDFESFMLYVEWEREPDKKFYPPRRKVLHRVVKELQKLADDEIDLLCISLPPGTGKTTLAIFYLTWLAGREPNKPMLTASHSASFVRGVYDECLRILGGNGEYLWSDIFPDVMIASTNAKDCSIDLGISKRFATFEFTSTGSSNAGQYRAESLLYCDDLVSGLEVALSKERLDKLWEIYTTDLRQRKKGNVCKELHIATRWSVHDIIGRLENEYGNNTRSSFVVVPALDKKGNSNFDYKYGVGFSTKIYHEQRDIMDDVSWRALYMNEPIEREGLLYSSEELRRYFEFPNNTPDAIIGVCDTKDKGKDYAFLPVVYVYGNDYYVADCVCDNGLPDVVDARLAEVLLRHKVQSCRFESNSSGGRIAEKIQGVIKEKGGITHITTKFTSQNKETKIIVNSSWVKEHCLFLDDDYVKKGSDYYRMLNMLTGYTVVGKNKHDDVPDGMAMLSEYAQSFMQQKVEVFQRPW